MKNLYYLFLMIIDNVSFAASVVMSVNELFITINIKLVLSPLLQAPTMAVSTRPSCCPARTLSACIAWDGSQPRTPGTLDTFGNTYILYILILTLNPASFGFRVRVYYCHRGSVYSHLLDALYPTRVRRNTMNLPTQIE